MKNETTEPQSSGAGVTEMELFDEWITPRTLARSLGIKPADVCRLTAAHSGNQVLTRTEIETAMAAHRWKPKYSSEVRNA